jgi:cytochrome P450 PksS
MTRLNLQSTELHNNAHAHFARLRREEPVHRARFGLTGEVYFVARFSDVEALLKDTGRVVKDPKNSVLGPRGKHAMWLPGAMETVLRSSVITTDDPTHRRLRGLVARAFTPRAIAELKPAIERVAQELVEGAVKAKSGDLIKSFALPLPVEIITEMVGVPRRDRELFKGFIHDIILPPGPINMLRMMRGFSRFMAYVRKLSDFKRKDPGPDLLSALVHAQDEGAQLSDEEVAVMAFTLLTAGHETTVSLIANGTRALLAHPEQLEKLRADRSLLPGAVEEMMRFDGPLLGTELYYARDTFTLHDVTVPAGAPVLPLILSANRDESVFPGADTFDITRTPNRHLAFGTGVHACIGAALTRLEASVAFSALLDGMPRLRLAVPDGELRYRAALFLHRLERLPVHTA